jgi:hypothetical protein
MAHSQAPAVLPIQIPVQNPDAFFLYSVGAARKMLLWSDHNR